jgi:hypothetical protein
MIASMKEIQELGNGAGEGNRTLVFSLEGCCSTIELHPHALFYAKPRGGLQWSKSVAAAARIYPFDSAARAN